MLLYKEREGESEMPTLDDLIAEAALRKTELARETGIAPATITRISHGGPTTRVTVNKILKVLERHLGRRIEVEHVDGLNITK